jgi:hypothetical protein
MTGAGTWSSAFAKAQALVSQMTLEEKVSDERACCAWHGRDI